jgi:hypothetical protein
MESKRRLLLENSLETLRTRYKYTLEEIRSYAWLKGYGYYENSLPPYQALKEMIDDHQSENISPQSVVNLSPEDISVVREMERIVLNLERYRKPILLLEKLSGKYYQQLSSIQTYIREFKYMSQKANHLAKGGLTELDFPDLDDAESVKKIFNEYPKIISYFVKYQLPHIKRIEAGAVTPLLYDVVAEFEGKDEAKVFMEQKKMDVYMDFLNKLPEDKRSILLGDRTEVLRNMSSIIDSQNLDAYDTTIRERQAPMIYKVQTFYPDPNDNTGESIYFYVRIGFKK